MKTVLRILLIIVIIIVAGLGVLYFTLNKPLPQGERDQAADALAEKMLGAVNKVAWDSTNVVKWTFKGVHNYVWDKENNLVEVKWDDKRVLLNLNEWEKGIAYEGEAEHIGDKRGELLGTAYAYFCNDSFWLIAPLKVKEEGVILQSVAPSEGEGESLLASYTSGGVTPGDSYQWFLDENGLPTHYRMWVSIIPIGGVEATWEAWETKSTGVKLPNLHKFGPVTLDMGEPETGNSLTDIGVSEILFAEIK
jgi:uncharacterized protein YpmB